MKPSRGDRFIVSAVFAIMGCALGCGQAGEVSGGSSAGSGGGNFVPPCSWGASGGLSFPVCPAKETSEFMGTIDGMPYDTKDSGHITAMAPPHNPPYFLSMILAGGGSLDLSWGDPYVPGRWTHLGDGTIVLPGETMPRLIHPYDSQILFSCDEYAFLYILHVYGGDLTGCSR